MTDAMRLPRIEDSFEKMESYPCVAERYYKCHYFLSGKGPRDEHHCVLVHSNRICVIGLSPTHPIVRGRKTVRKMEFQVTSKVDRLENRVRGKSKKGGQHLMPDSVLCYVECEDGDRYTIWSCMKGKLLEVNQMLVENPNLLIEKPTSEGFVAIILPSIKDVEVYKSKLLTREQYLSCVESDKKD